MALKHCKECGKEVSTQADKCPHCGATLKTKIGCFASAIIIIAFLILISHFTSNDSKKIKDTSLAPSSKTDKVAERKIFKMEEGFRVGYTSYYIWDAYWSDNLSKNRYLNDRPNASFLFITLSVRNEDTKPRTIPPFKLIDENHAEYETSSKAWAVPGALGIIENLNPNVSKGGIIVFDVPKQHLYQLKVSGGYWSKDDAYVNLVPGVKKSQKKKSSKK